MEVVEFVKKLRSHDTTFDLREAKKKQPHLFVPSTLIRNFLYYVMTKYKAREINIKNTSIGKGSHLEIC